ncbi:MAG TPA: uracil-DNA glycosylase [Candidatus Fimisoma avicola]|uniref:Uracil-DNA glycosylase n=1 Tax=Candidatus Fimisoma avicola TaxID=2840826 RepID=A0A9D1I554_9FIRM|nr:uracil-DNA glycosylase [Candidatus Fimisoma avicola]
MTKIGNDWDIMLQDEFDRPYFKRLENFLTEERARYEIYPPQEDVFNALRYSSFQDTKVVILGQDPYHEPGQAHGLCFSVNKGVTIPPSLVNIYKEIENDLGIKMPGHGYLADWAKQGVLLLNTVLTVRRGQANSHKGKGWEIFTDRIVEILNERQKPMVFILWGANAKSKTELITNKEHMVITGAHPSPLSAWKGFFGGRYFSKANRYLEITGQEPVDWGIL